MRNKLTSAIGVAAIALTMSTYVNAAPITISFDTVGALPEATFGGSGIPNSEVAQSVFGGPEICTTRCRPSTTTIKMGLSSHGRYENELEGNDGAGTYYASAGSNTPPSSSLEGSTWNFNYFIDIDGGNFGGDIDFNLYYDFDSAEGNDMSTHGVLNFREAINLFQIDPSLLSQVQGSENAMFSFLSASSSAIAAPTAAFDPNAAGEYTFALVASHGNGIELGRTAIRVIVQSVDVPEPSTFAIFALGLVGIASRRLMKK